MQVPEYKEQVQIGTPNRPVPQTQPQDASAFGVRQAGATADLGQAVAGLGERLAGHVIAKQELDNQQAVLEQATAYKEQVNNALRGTVDPATGQVTGGFLNTRLNAAQGATKQFADTMGKIAPQYIDKMKSEGQKRALANSMRQDYDSAMNLVAQHEATQGRDAKLASFDTYFNASLQEVASQPTTLAKNIDVVREKMWTYVQPVTGNKPEQTAQQIKDYNAKLVAAAITPAIQSGRLADARKILDENKANIPGTIYNTVDADLKDREFAAGVQTIWDKQMSGYKLADGMPDEAKMEQAVNALPSYTQEQKDKVWGYVKARANERRGQITMEQNAKDTAFLNALAQVKTVNQGMDLLKNTNYVYGPSDVETKSRMIAKKFEPEPVKTNYDTYMNLWKRVEVGKATPAEINAAFLGGRLSQSDAIGLQKELFNFKESPTGKLTPSIKATLDQIEIDAQKKYSDKRNGKGEKLLSEYMYVVTQKAKTTQDPSELRKFAEDMKKNVTVQERWWIIPDKTAPAFEVSYESQKARQLEAGNLKAIIGNDVLNGLTRAGVRDYGEFIKTLSATVPRNKLSAGKFGGLTIKDIEMGTPINNAMLSLISRNREITPEAIATVLRNYENGEWR